jgi:uncharacterized membrane protein YqgA involved in biofilm formation
MLIGPYINGTAVVMGGMSGAFLGAKLPERIRTALPQTFGLASMGLGIALITKVHFLPAVVLALVIGAILGEMFYLEKNIGKLGAVARKFADKIPSNNGNISHDEFQEKFVAILVLFCASGTGIFGAMTEGMTGDPSILYVKTILDLFTSAIFATALGYSVATIAVPQLAIQLLLAMGATHILPLTTPIMMGDFSATGGLIMLATGFRISGIKIFPVANLLPALILIMPFHHLWSLFFK